MLKNEDKKIADGILKDVDENSIRPSTDILESTEIELKGGEENNMPQVIDDYATYDIPKGDSRFLKLENGATRLRLCSKPTEMKSHEISAKGAKFATAPCQGEKCELCKQGKRINYKYAYVILNRQDNKIQVYEAPITVFRQIAAYANNPEYGDPTAYDLTINREGEKPQITYTVIASPKPTPLTDEEKKLLLSSEVTIESAYTSKE